jgi:hypothetical protein
VSSPLESRPGDSTTTVPTMNYVRAEAVRWIDEEWPGQVEIHLRVADGSTTTLTDKAPVFDGDDVLIPGAALPMAIEIPCDILRRTARTATVRLHFALQDGAGKGTFDVSENDVIARHSRDNASGR